MFFNDWHIRTKKQCYYDIHNGILKDKVFLSLDMKGLREHNKVSYHHGTKRKRNYLTAAVNSIDCAKELIYMIGGDELLIAASNEDRAAQILKNMKEECGLFKNAIEFHYTISRELHENSTDIKKGEN